MSSTPAFTPSLPISTPTPFHPPFTRTPPLTPKPPPKRTRPPLAIIEPLNRLTIHADLHTPIASGSFGEVFFGSLQPTGEPVVLKRAMSGSIARTLFRTERTINQKIDPGPNTKPTHWPKYLGHYFRNSQTFLVWLREGNGETLQDYLSRRPPAALAAALQVPYSSFSKLNVALFRAVVTALLTALDELHDRGVVHRDVKPANILVAPVRTKNENALKLIDFGSSCDVGNLLWSRGIDTLDPLYAAPEQRLSMFAPEKFDVFSVGMIGVSVLMPSFANEARLREFRARLEKADFDLGRYRREFTCAAGVCVGAEAELAALFDGRNDEVGEVFGLLAAMLKRNPAGRKSVKACLDQLRVCR